MIDLIDIRSRQNETLVLRPFCAFDVKASLIREIAVEEHAWGFCVVQHDNVDYNGATLFLQHDEHEWQGRKTIASFALPVRAPRVFLPSVFVYNALRFLCTTRQRCLA